MLVRLQNRAFSRGLGEEYLKIGETDFARLNEDLRGAIVFTLHSRNDEYIEGQTFVREIKGKHDAAVYHTDNL